MEPTDSVNAMADKAWLFATSLKKAVTSVRDEICSTIGLEEVNSLSWQGQSNGSAFAEYDCTLSSHYTFFDGKIANPFANSNTVRLYADPQKAVQDIQHDVGAIKTALKSGHGDYERAGEAAENVLIKQYAYLSAGNRIDVTAEMRSNMEEAVTLAKPYAERDLLRRLGHLDVNTGNTQKNQP